MANVSSLLYTTTESECFLDALELDAVDRGLLQAARRKIREHLRAVFARASREALGTVVVPRFFTQGSYSYKTINEPAHVPPQQMDLDDGCYLPMTFVQGAKPSVAALRFFELVDEALKELAKQEGWTFVSKPTCARLVINKRAHVDIPLYAIPDKEFVLLEKAAMRAAAARDSAIRADIADRWDALPSNCVLLAHREDDWISSDPRKIADWFKGAIEVHGEVLRRVCRYLKAWRDYHARELDSLSSIVLMVCTWRAFEDVGRKDVPSRDDQALLMVASKLPKFLAGEIANPTNRNERLDRNLEDGARRSAIRKAEDLASRLGKIVHDVVEPQQAVDDLTAVFGPRIPDAPELVSVKDAAHAEVRRYPAKEVPAPTVGRSTSG
jgi:hypothetical protein